MPLGKDLRGLELKKELLALESEEDRNSRRVAAFTIVHSLDAFI